MISTSEVRFYVLSVAALALLASAAAAAQTTGEPKSTLTVPTIRRDGKVELRPVDESSKPRGPRPRTPSDQLRVRLPLDKPGCYKLVGTEWRPIPCATREYIKTHYMPPPVYANSIQSTPPVPSRTIFHPGPVFPRPGTNVPKPFDWGSVTVSFTSDPTLATEGSGSVATATDPGTFSIQTNTNYFPCAPCSSGSPFAATPGIPNSASAAGDTGWVQFVYQQYSYGAYGQANTRFCIWNVDTTVAGNTKNAAGYAPTCIYPSDAGSIAPLAGQGAPAGPGEVIGYIYCPTVGSNVGCSLWGLAQLPWAEGIAWYLVEAPDLMGLAGSWTNVSGGILGSGGGNEAYFSNATLLQEVRGYSCYETPQSATGSAPDACPPPPALFRNAELTASPAESYVTGESNNLTNSPVTFSCGPYDCWMTFTSTAQ